MFFLKTLSRTMTLHPSFFNPMIQEYLQNELLRSVEGNLQGDYYVICVLDNNLNISRGMVIPGTGRVEYTINYRAVCFKPFRGEVVDGMVSSVIKTGFFVEVGPLLAFVSDAVCLELNADKVLLLTAILHR
jgi:DNA-directed RNA polymerase II subunit RPB7